MAQDWDIKPRSEACSACGKEFDDGELCYSSLVFGEEGYARKDRCSACWEHAQSSGAPYSAWQGVFRKPPPPREEPLKKENAESLLRRLIEDGEDETRNVRFILTVMLERKRVLVERDSQLQPDGTLVRVYEHRHTGETFVINDPRLDLDQIESVQREVMAMLGGAPAPAEGEPAGGEESTDDTEVVPS